MCTLMRKDALMELGAHVSALISRSLRGTPEAEIDTPDQIAVGLLRGYISGSDHTDIDGDEVSNLFQNIRRRYEPLPYIAHFKLCDDIEDVRRQCHQKYEFL